MSRPKIKFPSIKELIPVLDWLPKYKKAYFPGDLSAGITVGVMLIPQGMAYAMLAGLEPIHGLYAVTIPLFLYAIFGTSRQLAVGPVAMVSLLTAAGIGSLDPEGPQEYLKYALTLAFLVGLIQFGMGVLRLGFVVNFMAHPVISGFTSAAAIIIGLSQIKHLFGIELPRSEHIQDMAAAVFRNIGDTHWITLIIGISAVVLIKFGKKIHKTFPAALVAVIIGILAVTFFDLNQTGVAVVGEVPGGLPSFMMPSFDTSSWGVLFPIALAISLVGFAESYAVAKSVHARHKDYKPDPNQELIGLGMANFGASFFKGYPVTGGFSRTAVNDQAGAKTGLASIFSSVLIVLTLLFLTGLFENLPNAVLAAVVIVAVSGLIDYKEAVNLWKKDKADFALLIVTFSATLTLGIETGIIGGMALSIIMVIYRASRPHMARLGRIPGTDVFRNLDRFSNLESSDDVLIVRVDGPIYFANLEFIKRKIDDWASEQKETLKLIVLDMETVSFLDGTGAHELKEWIINHQKAGVHIHITGAKGPVRDVLSKWEITEVCGKDNIFLTIEHCVAAYYGKDIKINLEEMKEYSLQSRD